ncbi:molybdate transporter 1-like [Selaginella moellendorffii]|uniref:molybdate transporter 1-like n=1 Tax=Selaginella moellendorffii TaxID=88036 RepID=UPI000D1CD5CC|nr:molybdate transporter 1-like [Selaginella moellendorffii]|eukprot:XP_024515740.1 molybdate transporter 1-like [Selaginella moellendorffii]
MEEEGRAGGAVDSPSDDAWLSSNLQCKRPWQELSGSLGDLGTFIPIVIALALVNGVDLGTSLIATGIYNILTGVLFGVPMPVQPMKSIAAVAITESKHLTVDQIMAAGITVSAIVFALGITGLIRVVAWIVPLPVVRGIQLAQGLSFAVKAVKYVMKDQNLSSDKAKGDRPWLGLDGILLAVICFAFIVLVNGSGEGYEYLVTNSDGGGRHHDDREEHREEHQEGSSKLVRFFRRIPTALAVFVLGIILAFVRRPHILKELHFGPATPRIARISSHDWKTGFVRAAIPQLPLTILNSVVAVCKLSSDLFPAKKDGVSPTKVSVSVGLMNLVGCWFGALPVCHGAGGLAGQYRFGATSGVAVAMLGVAKLVLGLLLGSSLVRILQAFPVGLLGILLLFSGVELAMACRDQTSRKDSFVMLSCVAISQGSNLAVGCVCAILLYALLQAREMDCWAIANSWPRGSSK